MTMDPKARRAVRNAAFARQRDWIASTRALLKPSPVRLNHIPRWFGLALRQFRDKHATAWQALQNMKADTDAYWLDHFGSTIVQRGDESIVAFVSEPYGFGPKDAAALDKLSELAGVKWYVDPNSWHYPGATIRVVILPYDMRNP